MNGAAQGHRIGRYEVGAELGRGAMGVVYLARRDAGDREVALKVFDAGRDLAPETRDVLLKRFHREIRAARTVSHSVIVPILDAGNEGSLYYFAMPIVPGMTLEDRLTREPPLRRKHALHVAIKVAGALAAAHELGVIHRDVKSANIMLAPKGRVYLLDFGLARFVSAATQLTGTDDLLGSPYAMAPEIVMGKTADHRCDLYSTGAVLFEMVYGQPPFVHPKLQGLLMAITSAVLVFPALPAASSALVKGYCVTIRRAMARDPANRLPRAGDLIAELRYLQELENREAQAG